MYIVNLGLKFESIAEKYQDNIAIIFENGHTVTYAQLNSRANRLARYLTDQGIRQTDVVAMSGKKCPEIYIGIIASLKIGAIYTIFDPDSPLERVNKILHKATPKALVLDNEQEKKLTRIITELDVSVINNNNGFNKLIDPIDDGNLSITRTITGENPAYLMFTSGSTGFPKGAVMTHQNVLNFIKWSIDTYKITTEDVLTNVNPMYFDNSVFDFYSSVFSGASLAPFGKKTVTDPKTLIAQVEARKCTIWFSVPTLLIFLQTMRALNQNSFKTINKIIFGGEGYPKSKLKQLFDIYGERAELFNVYGPTECTCICTSYKITEEDFGDLQEYPPLGRIIANFSYLILGENNKKVTDHELGELCLLGPNVGKGYYNDPELTFKSFVQNPYNLQYHEIMYKTGDLVKYNPDDGKLYIAGRVDNQIKHMGYRIELEEIENAICRLENITQAAALQFTVRGLSRILAIVSTKDDLEEMSLINSLRSIIPDYMIPSEIHFLDELPKNQNGKIDRVKLREMYQRE